jgi:DNA-directed RNA polymerase beta' subunit
LIRDENKKIEKVQIGDFVKMCIDTTDKLDYNKSKDTSYAPTMSYYEIPSVSEEGDVVWKQIEAGTQHPVVNKDGTNTLLKITTFEQRVVIATKAKSFLQLVDGKILPVDGDSLKVGQYLPVSLKPIEFKETFQLDMKNINSNTEKVINLNEELARDLAHYCLRKDVSNIDICSALCNIKNNYSIIQEIVHSNKSFVNEFVRTLTYDENKNDFQLSDIFKNNFDIMNMIMNSDINVSNVLKPSEYIPNMIDDEIVMEKRQEGCMDELLFDQIISIEEVSNPTDYVYDLTVKDTRNFNIYNGLALRDTFHFAGVASKSNVTRGVPRIEEILSLSSEIKNPSLSIYLHKEDETNKERARTIMYMLEHTKLQELVKNVQLCFDPDDLNTLIVEDKEMIEQYMEFNRLFEDCNNNVMNIDEAEKSKWIIRLELDHEAMLEKNITMDDINFTLVNVYDTQISCIYSDYNSDKLIFRIRLNEAIKSSSKNAGKLTLDQSDKIYMLKNFQDQMLNNIVIRGVKKINKVNLRKIRNNYTEENGQYVKRDIWVLDTIGTNLMDVLSLDYIDNERTFSNDIVEVYKVLGIEAARQMIYNELVDVIEFDGTYINYHNFSVLIDRMTYSHKLISIFRHGINNDNIGPLAKASFEETPEMFLRAARHGEIDNMRGISANVMCGQEGYYGTSSFQVLLNIKEMMNQQEASEYKPINKDEVLETFFKEENEEDKDKDVCSISNLTIQNNVININPEDDENENTYDPGF